MVKMALIVAVLLMAGMPVVAADERCGGGAPAVPEEIKAYDLDFNWGPGGPNGFAGPGHWADADPARHVAWYKAMGVNVIQTFCVSCNGYAWYKNGAVPEQPGLKHDFLRDVVKGAHKEGMLVLGYFCAGSNTRWGREHPTLSYGIPSAPHIPYTDEYLAYLDGAVRDAVRTTGIDGFMVDWLRMPTSRASNGGKWLDCEKKLYAQLMGEPFPGERELPAAKMVEYGRRAVDRTWGVIRKAAKETNPHCIVWLTCCDVNDPHIANSRALRETDWLLNEAGDVRRTADAKRMIGPQTRLITCLALWNGQDPSRIVPAARKEGIGLYGFTRPGADSLLPLDAILSQPVGTLSGDAKSIAMLARVFHGLPLDAPCEMVSMFANPVPGYLQKYAALYARSPRQASLAWFQDAKFGMMVSYGPTSPLGVHPFYQWQKRIPVVQYEALVSNFKAEKFDAEAIADLAAKAGMSYITFVAKHCDGFCLWNTKYTTFNSMNSPAKRDFVAEMAAACQKHGLGLFLFYEHGFEWHHPHGPRFTDFKTPMAEVKYTTPEPTYAYGKDYDLNKYLDYAANQIIEMMEKCGPVAGVWLDGVAVPLSAKDSRLFRCQELYDRIHQCQPQALISYKHGVTGTEDFKAPEAFQLQHISMDRESKPVELCEPLNGSWYYVKGEPHRDAAWVWKRLAFTRTHKMNYLLGVGLLPDGSVSPKDAGTLLEIGRRIKQAGWPGGERVLEGPVEKPVAY